MPYLKEARDSGATIVVIDPRATGVARQADIHLPVRPGTDLVVALAIHRYLFEEGFADQAFLDAHTTGAEQLRERARPWTFERAAEISGVPADRLREVAALYARSSPALVKCGWGLERNRNGGSAAAAVMALPAVGGKFGIRGGGYSMSNSASWGIERTWLRDQEPATRAVNMNLVGRELTAPSGTPIKSLFVYNCNPAVTLPDQARVIQGLQREDLFTVVFDQVMTDSALYADVVLPATTFLEHYDYAKGYGALSLQLGRPVIEAVGESRSNTDVFMDLVRRMDLSREGDPEDDIDAMLTSLAGLPGGDRRRIARALARDAALWRTARAVCRCDAEYGGRQGPPLPGVARRRSAARPLWLPGRSWHRALSVGAHLTGQREDGEFHAGRVEASRRDRRDQPGGRGGPAHRGSRRSADIQRSG